MKPMTQAQRIRMIRRDIRMAMAEGKTQLYLELIEELAIILRGT